MDNSMMISMGQQTLIRSLAIELNANNGLDDQALERIEHDQELHQVVIHRWRGRLDDEDIRAAHVLVDLHVILAIGKAVERDASRLDPDERADFLRERRMRPPREDLEWTVQAAQIIRKPR